MAKSYDFGIVDEDFLQELSSNPSHLFEGEHNADLVRISRSFDWHQVCVLDSSVISGTMGNLLRILRPLEAGTCFATTTGVMQEVLTPPRYNSDFSDNEELTRMMELRRNIFLGIAASGLLFSFDGFRDTPEYKLVEAIGGCTSKSYATNFLANKLDDWNTHLKHVIEGHPSYGALFSLDGVAQTSKQKIFEDIIKAVFEDGPIPTNRTKTYLTHERPSVAVGAMARGLENHSSQEMRRIAEKLEGVVDNGYFKLGKDARKILYAYGREEFVTNYSRHIRRTVSGFLNRVLDAVISQEEVTTFSPRDTNTVADTETLLLAYLFANQDENGGSVLHAVNDGSMQMPTLERNPLAIIQSGGLPYYADYDFQNKPVRVCLATNDSDHFEQLHFLRDVKRV